LREVPNLRESCIVAETRGLPKGKRKSKEGAERGGVDGGGKKRVTLQGIHKQTRQSDPPVQVGQSTQEFCFWQKFRRSKDRKQSRLGRITEVQCYSDESSINRRRPLGQVGPRGESRREREDARKGGLAAKIRFQAKTQAKTRGKYQQKQEGKRFKTKKLDRKAAEEVLQ